MLEHVVVLVLSVIGILLLVLWQAVPSEIWVRVSDAVPKRVLWALLALALILILLELAYILYLRRKSGAINVASRQVAMFGVLRDENANPLCPICKILMYPTRRKDENNHLYQIVKCPNCKNGYVLKNDNTSRVELSKAKEMLVKRYPEVRHDI